MISLSLLSLLAVFAGAEDSPALVVSRLQDETAARIQSGVLDPILGPERGTVFVRLTARVSTTGDDEEKSGTGSADKSWGAEAVEASTAAPRGREENRQSSRQARGHATRTTTAALDFPEMRVVVLYDTDVPPKRLETARRALLAVYAPDLKADGVRFEPAEHARRP